MNVEHRTSNGKDRGRRSDNFCGVAVVQKTEREQIEIANFVYTFRFSTENLLHKPDRLIMIMHQSELQRHCPLRQTRLPQGALRERA